MTNDDYLDDAIGEYLAPHLEDLIDEGWHRDEVLASLRRLLEGWELKAQTAD
jgi:hypothetical protein